jgi:putative membrane protein (TIGR04086 family)
LILLFAVTIRFLNVPDKAIFPVNQIIKIVSLFVGISIVLKKTKSKGFFTGIIVGLCYFLVSFFVFSILQNSFTFSLNNLYDLILTTLMSGIIGIILINFFKN